MYKVHFLDAVEAPISFQWLRRAPWFCVMMQVTTHANQTLRIYARPDGTYAHTKSLTIAMMAGHKASLNLPEPLEFDTVVQEVVQDTLLFPMLLQEAALLLESMRCITAILEHPDQSVLRAMDVMKHKRKLYAAALTLFVEMVLSTPLKKTAMMATAMTETLV